MLAINREQGFYSTELFIGKPEFCQAQVVED